MKFGIIGGGFGVDGYLSALSAMAAAEVVAVSDSGSGRVLGKLPDSNLYIGNWLKMKRAPVDTVCIVTPPSTHLEMVKALLASGKNVVCEKPFGASAAQSQDMAVLARNSNNTTAVTYQFRFEPGFQKLKSLLDGGRYGELLSINCVWLTAGRSDRNAVWTWQHDTSQGGGVIGAFQSHVIDLIQWLTNSTISEVSARTEIHFRQRPLPNGSMAEVTAEDTVKTQMSLANGVSANCYISWCNPRTEGLRMELVHTNGTLIYSHTPPFTSDTQCIHVHTSNGEAKKLFSANEVLSGDEGDTRLPALQSLFREFMNSVSETGSSQLPSFDDGWSVQKILDAVRQSAKTQESISC